VSDPRSDGPEAWPNASKFHAVGAVNAFGRIPEP